MYAYNPQTEHGGDGGIYGRAVGVENVFVDLGALRCIRGDGLSFVGSTR